MISLLAIIPAAGVWWTQHEAIDIGVQFLSLSFGLADVKQERKEFPFHV